MIEKLLVSLGKSIGTKAGLIGKLTVTHAPSSLTHDVKDLADDGLVSHEYLKRLITRSRTKEQLGRILHYLDHNNTNNLTPNQWSELRSLVFDRFKDMKIAQLLSHLDLIIMHLF